MKSKKLVLYRGGPRSARRLIHHTPADGKERKRKEQKLISVTGGKTRREEQISGKNTGVIQ
eukprot:scaffold23326_cov56-Isochrysis_galbana.AAC.1